MIILIAGDTHTGKTLLAQRLLEKYKYPYLSIDHLKMGLIRSGQCGLSADSSDAELTEYLWPIVREMIKTCIENSQNQIVVAGMEDALAVGLYHPRHAAVVASGGRHAKEFVFPRGTFPQPGIGFFFLCPTVFQDVFRKDVAHVRFPGLPGKDVAVEMVFMKMAGEDGQGLGRLQQTGHHAGRVHPVVEHEDAAVGLKDKAAVEDIGELHRLLE